jgi:hypothetical protein
MREFRAQQQKDLSRQGVVSEIRMMRIRSRVEGFAQTSNH